MIDGANGRIGCAREIEEGEGLVRRRWSNRLFCLNRERHSDAPAEGTQLLSAAARTEGQQDRGSRVRVPSIGVDETRPRVASPVPRLSVRRTRRRDAHHVGGDDQQRDHGDSADHDRPLNSITLMHLGRSRAGPFQRTLTPRFEVTVASGAISHAQLGQAREYSLSRAVGVASDR